MCILNIEYRVFITVGFCKFNIKIKSCVYISHSHPETCCVNTDFFYQIVKRHHIFTFAHTDFVSVYHKVNKLAEQNFKFVRIIAKSLYGGFYSGNITVVVCTPDVYHSVKASFKFIYVVCNISSQICVGAIGFFYYSILIIAVIRRFKPIRSVFLINLSAVFKFLNTFIDLA